MPIKILVCEKFVCDASTEAGIMDLKTGIKLHCNITVMESELCISSNFVRLPCSMGFSFLHFIHYWILLIFRSFFELNSLNMALFTPSLALYGHILDLKMLIFFIPV